MRWLCGFFDGLAGVYKRPAERWSYYRGFSAGQALGKWRLIP